MYMTVTLLLLIGAFIILFSNELMQYVKKLFKIRGMKTILPLFFASWLVVTTEYWLWLIAMYCYYGMLFVVHQVSPWIPYPWVASWLPISVLISLIAVVPVGIYEKLHRPHSHEPKHHADYVSTLIWLACLIIWLSAPDAEAFIH